jgi:predicted metalloprotease
MRWRGRRQSDNVEDLRGQGGGFGGGFRRGGPRLRIPIGARSGRGGGISGIIILVVLFFVLKAVGIDPMQVLATLDGSGGTQMQSPGVTTARNDEMKQFVSTVLADTEDVWSGIFRANGSSYSDPTLVLFSGSVRSACGMASAASGPFYCPNDRKAYIDLSFYNELSRKFGASGDFAQAYVLAHEIGHHVQNLIGVLPAYHKERETLSQVEANRLSVRVELQADCFAGIWAHFTDQKGLLENGDIDEALNAAHRIGDDTLQRRTQGYVVPDSFNHGTSDQRAKWFRRGYEGGKLTSCDTFNNPV